MASTRSSWASESSQCLASLEFRHVVLAFLACCGRFCVVGSRHFLGGLPRTAVLPTGWKGMVIDPFGTGFNSLKLKSTWDRLPVREVVLNAGDVYVNPGWFWHKVKNLPDPETGLVFMNS